MKEFFGSLALAGCLLGFAACGGGGHHQAAPGNNAPPSTATGAVSGRITDQGTALALPGVAVYAQDAQKPTILAKATTAADGTYTLAQLPLGVPIRVVAQPVTGSLAYAARMSQPITLVKDTPQPAVDLACAQAAQTGTVELAKAAHPVRGAEIALVRALDPGDGNLLKAVVRIGKPGADGVFRFDHVPAGQYEVHFLFRGRGHARPKRPRPQRPPGRHRKHRGPKVVEITVKAAESTHVNWPAKRQAAAGDPEEVEDLEAQP